MKKGCCWTTKFATNKHKSSPVAPTPTLSDCNLYRTSYDTDRVLERAEAEHIANLASQLETLFDEPQDVEWSYYDQTLYLLQSRPITTRAESYPYDDQLVVFKPLVENFSEPLSPLSEDLFASVLPDFGVMFTGGYIWTSTSFASLCL